MPCLLLFILYNFMVILYFTDYLYPKATTPECLKSVKAFFVRVVTWTDFLFMWQLEAPTWTGVETLRLQLPNNTITLNVTLKVCQKQPWIVYCPDLEISTIMSQNAHWPRIELYMFFWVYPIPLRRYFSETFLWTVKLQIMLTFIDLTLKIIWKRNTSQVDGKWCNGVIRT